MLVAAIVAAHVVPLAEHDAFFRGAVFDVGHVLGFAFATMVLTALLRRATVARGLGAEVGYLSALSLMFVVAVLAEAAQYLTPRDTSFADLLRDVLGIAGGFAAVAALGAHSTSRIGLFAAGAACLLAGLLAPLGAIAARTTVWLDSSTEFGFETWRDRRLVARGSVAAEVVPAPTEWPTQGNVLRMIPNGEQDWEGFSFYGMPRDWSGYSSFSFVAAAADAEPHELVLHVDSSRTGTGPRQRYRSSFTVGTEPREIEISVAEIANRSARGPVDVTDVEAVKILAYDAAGLAFYFDDLRLR